MTAYMSDGAGHSVPTLADLVHKVGSARSLPLETIAEFLAQCWVAQPALLATLVSSCQSGQGQQAEIRLLKGRGSRGQAQCTSRVVPLPGQAARLRGQVGRRHVAIFSLPTSAVFLSPRAGRQARQSQRVRRRSGGEGILARVSRRPGVRGSSSRQASRRAA
jgi:hypothetical protein